jgi:hypothetical protein
MQKGFLHNKSTKYIINLKELTHNHFYHNVLYHKIHVLVLMPLLSIENNIMEGRYYGVRSTKFEIPYEKTVKVES